MNQFANSPPPYVVRPPETSPLLPGKASRRRFGSHGQWTLTIAVALLTAVVMTTIFASVFPISSCNDPLDPDVQERVRKEWDIERSHHEEEVRKRRDVELRWRAEDAKRIHIREEWAREIEQHRREENERPERERQERLKLNMFWTDPEPHTCTSYGTREYTARLVNVPATYNLRVEACMDTPIKVHGIEYKAKWCEDHGPDNVIGHWKVDQHEPDCVSYWSWYKDFGCASPGSGQRGVEHYLENIPPGSDWREFCATTPARFRGMHFTGAHVCFKKNGGVYGHWLFDDESCD